MVLVMAVSMSAKIRNARFKRGNMSERELALKMGDTPQNLNNKMKRDDFKVSDLQRIADALEVTLVVKFVDPYTGEEL